MGINMIIAGFGGQGVLFTGKVITQAGLQDGKEVSWIPSYGPEMRGGSASCSVCIDDEEIALPIVTRPELLIVMNGPSFDKFIGKVAPGGKVVYDSSLIESTTDRTDIELFPVPATQLSKENGLDGIANIIMLGKALKETGFSTFESVEKAIEKCVPPRKSHLLEFNVKAVKLGMSL
jgi:2-oxoglutarate ferredoxin oxidoreductase subunit gamma